MSDCEHCDLEVGYLCDMCARDARISELEAENAALKARLKAYDLEHDETPLTPEWLDERCEIQMFGNIRFWRLRNDVVAECLVHPHGVVSDFALTRWPKVTPTIGDFWTMCRVRRIPIPEPKERR